MADRASRRAEQQAKINAMPLGKRFGMVALAVLSAFVVILIMQKVLDDELDLGIAALISVAAGAGLSYQYLWVPSRS